MPKPASDTGGGEAFERHGLFPWAAIRVPAGGSAVVDVTVPVRRLAYWADGWQYEAGEYVLRAGTTAVDLPLSSTLTLRA